MVSLEFDAVIESDGVIRVPADIADQVSKGVVIRVSIVPKAEEDAQKQARRLSYESLLQRQRERIAGVAGPMPEDAWREILNFIDRRAAKGPLPGVYKWQREDAYEHLTERYGPDRTD